MATPYAQSGFLTPRATQDENSLIAQFWAWVRPQYAASTGSQIP